MKDDDDCALLLLLFWAAFLVGRSENGKEDDEEKDDNDDFVAPFPFVDDGDADVPLPKIFKDCVPKLACDDDDEDEVDDAAS